MTVAFASGKLPTTATGAITDVMACLRAELAAVLVPLGVIVPAPRRWRRWE